jgi:hypothetical protein
MAGIDISISSDGMERITELMLLSVIQHYIPFIFGANAKIEESRELASLAMRPDFIISLSENHYAIVEVKNQSPNTQVRLNAVANQLQEYSDAFKHFHPEASVSLVLIMVGALSEENRAYLAYRGIDRVIDTAELQRLTKSDTGATNVTVSDTDTVKGADAEQLPKHTQSESMAETLLTTLESTPPGRPAWVQYQKWVGSALEYLFYPQLAKPISELSNQTRTNRRDFIFPNYATEGFWAFLRSHYSAHFVVVDAKNLTKRVSKAEVLQLANYLSDHGAGLFGLIVSRHQSAYGAEVTQREQWAIHRKMIIVLNDTDMKQMFTIYLSGDDPSDLIRQKIEDFRLSF